MANKLYEETSIQAIANAIRSKNGSSDTYTVAQMASAIENIPSGGWQPVGDGKTRITVRPIDSETPVILALFSNSSLTIDWGDGSPVESVSGGDARRPHTYSEDGEYTIILTCADTYQLGTAALGIVDDDSQTVVQYLEVAPNVGTVGTYQKMKYGLKGLAIYHGANGLGNGLSNSVGLQEVYLPNTLLTLGDTFEGCSSLKKVNITSPITSLGASTFKNCTAMQAFEAINTEANSTLNIGVSCFQGCTALINVTLQAETLDFTGNNAFYGCEGLLHLKLIGNVNQYNTAMLYNCRNLREFDIAVPTNGAIPNNMFYQCASLKEMIIPVGITSIGSGAFYGCTSLTTLSIPEGVTELPSTSFMGCSSLTSITIPSTVTAIGAQALRNCSSVTEYHIKPTTPPTLANTNAFTGINSNCIMYVPTGTLSVYQSTSNWSTYASYMQEESA